ncbi:MAG TPA: hypothetical protein VGR98_28050 [Streptosporangiaceae bacterium]|nr:hypothetical protein [Streptosporangiaceae bacterium]
MTSENADRVQIARMGGLARSARARSSTAMTEAARNAFWQSFYDQTDPALPEAERERQADAARRLYMTRLSRKAAAKRREAARAAAEAVEATEAELAALRGDDIAV